MAEAKELTPEEFRRMQLLQLDMLVELDRVCRKNHIRYNICYGTLLGAVRHKGYIPWDDDADVVMLREDYEKFKRIIGDLDETICYFQDHDTDPEYRWGYAKLRRTGTKYIRAGQEHLKCKTGVFIDIFPLDDVPKGLPAQLFQNFYCYCLRKILWSEVGKCESKGMKKLWFSMLSLIPAKTVYKLESVYSKKSRNDTSNGVRILLFPVININPLSIRYRMPKRWFLKSRKYLFEGKELYGMCNYDAFLRYNYGDYMKLPPIEERQQHAPVSSFKF